MRTTEEYASTYKGVALFALAAWDYENTSGMQAEPESEMIRTGRMQAYSNILKVITGRSIGTQGEIVRAVIDTMRS